MLHNFTERGKKVFQVAHREALRLGHDSLGTEHILLGLLEERDGIVYKVLESFNLDTDSLLGQFRKIIGRNISPRTSIDIPTDPRAKLVVELSAQEAGMMDSTYIGTEHILLGLLSEGEGKAAKFLASLGVTIEQCRLIVREMTEGSTPEDAESPRHILGIHVNKNNYKYKKNSANVSKTPTLDEVGIDLSNMAKNGELDPVIGRDKEIQRVVQILSRRTKNNPVLIGEPGVGKTAIAEALAQRILSGDIPVILKDKRVVQLNVANLVAGTKYRGEFEERMRKLVKEVRDNKKTILFIDEIHTLVGAGGAEGAVDAANILKPSLARGEFQVIGATTINEYRKYIEKDAALERRFQPVQVEEPSEEDAVLILKGLKENYEIHHNVHIPMMHWLLQQSFQNAI